MRLERRRNKWGKQLHHLVIWSPYTSHIYIYRELLYVRILSILWISARSVLLLKVEMKNLSFPRRRMTYTTSIRSKCVNFDSIFDANSYKSACFSNQSIIYLHPQNDYFLVFIPRKKYLSISLTLPPSSSQRI